MAYSYAHMTKETSSQGYLMFVSDLGLTEDNKKFLNLHPRSSLLTTCDFRPPGAAKLNREL
jgi:hypothetical protein